MTKNKNGADAAAQEPDGPWTREDVRLRLQALAARTEDEKIELRCLELLFDVAPAPEKASPMGSAFEAAVRSRPALPAAAPDVTTSQSPPMSKSASSS